MTATKELRLLLDERGVEWWEEYGFTYWKNRFGYSCNCATGHESGMVSVLFDAKPEQAVEATLGSDLEAENDKLRELLDYITPIAWYAASENERDRMRELGVEV